MENNEITINGRQYIVTSRVTFSDSPLTSAAMAEIGIGAFVMVRLTTGHREKAAYETLNGKFGGWMTR